MKKKIYLTYESSISDISEINKSVATGILRVAYTNENNNGSYISKEAFEKAIPTIYNKPIVGNFIREENDFGGHDIGIVKDDDGQLRIVNYTTPIGVVPESAQYFWDDINGHEYLCIDVVLWKRQEGFRKLKEDGIVSESMEIEVKNGYKEEDTDLFVIEDFEFTAFCLLGSGVTPCFEDAALELYSTNEMQSLIKQMMSEIKDTFEKIDPPEGADDNNDFAKGGNKVLDEKKELAAKFGIDIESLDFSIEEMSIEELTAKFEEMTAETPEEVDNPTPEPEAGPDTFALSREFVEELQRTLANEKVASDWGEEYSRYCFADYDPELNQVYAWDRVDNWILYGFNYSMDKDSIIIDFESKTRKKYAIVDFEEGAAPAQEISMLASEFTQLEKLVSDNAEWESKYLTASETIESMGQELNELKEFKASVEKENAAAEREELFSQFDDLAEDEAFMELVSHSNEYSIEELEEKCFALRGRKNTSNKFSLHKKSSKILVPREEDDTRKPYGGVVEKYLGE